MYSSTRNKHSGIMLWSIFLLLLASCTAAPVHRTCIGHKAQSWTELLHDIQASVFKGNIGLNLEFPPLRNNVLDFSSPKTVPYPPASAQRNLEHSGLHPEGRASDGSLVENKAPSGYTKLVPMGDGATSQKPSLSLREPKPIDEQKSFSAPPTASEPILGDGKIVDAPLMKTKSFEKPSDEVSHDDHWHAFMNGLTEPVPGIAKKAAAPKQTHGTVSDTIKSTHKLEPRKHISDFTVHAADYIFYQDHRLEEATQSIARNLALSTGVREVNLAQKESEHSSNSAPAPKLEFSRLHPQHATRQDSTAILGDEISDEDHWHVFMNGLKVASPKIFRKAETIEQEHQSVASNSESSTSFAPHVRHIANDEISEQDHWHAFMHDLRETSPGVARALAFTHPPKGCTPVGAESNSDSKYQSNCEVHSEL